MVNVCVYELILALRLYHVIALLSEASHDTEDGQFRNLGERITSFLDVVMEAHYCLLEVVDCSQSACTSDTRTTVQNYFVILRDVGHLLGV